MVRNMEAWIAQYGKMGALWIHDGNPKRPHALLTSGKHSNGFFNSGIVTANPWVLMEAANDLGDKMFNLGSAEQKLPIELPIQFRLIPDRVIGPAMGAITLANNLALYFAEKQPEPNCLTAFTEKDESTDGKTMTLKRFSLWPGEKCLAVEDVLTTGGSVEKTIKAITDAGGTALDYVAVLVNRSGLKEVAGRKIIALIEREMPSWEPDQCPLCRQGSEAIKSKAANNWERLNAEYPKPEPATV